MNMNIKLIAIIVVGMMVLNLSSVAAMAADDTKWTQVKAKDKNGKEYSELWEVQYYYYSNKETKSESGVDKKTLDKGKYVKAGFELGTKIKITDAANKSEVYTVVDSLKKDDKSTSGHKNNIIFIYCKDKAEYDKKNKALSDKVDEMIKKNIVENKTEIVNKMRISWNGKVFTGK